MAIEKIVVVDDEMMIRKALETQLRNKRYSVASTGDLKGARKILARDSFDLVFLDLRLPDGEGTDLLEEITAKTEAPMVVMMTGYGSVESAVSCMQMGAFDYVVKPFSFEQIEVVVDKVASFDKMRMVTKYYVEESDSRSSAIIGESEPIHKLKNLVDKVAKTEASVLITGENGTGKELVARAIHINSPRDKSPFISVNCAALPETLLESELFGHERGAYTGATSLKHGLFEVADTGKPWQEASVVDVVTGADAIEFFAGLAPAIEGNQQDLGGDFYYTRREPLGICAGIGAWNYPLQIACWKAAPALACGNAMIFKPSEETPRGAIMLANIFVEAGVPAGVFNVVHGSGEVGAQLSSHEAIAKVSFTGAVTTGQSVMASAAATLKDVTMELGGKSPLIIFEDADIEEAVSAAMLGNFYTQGEICTNGTRVFVHRNILPAFTEQLLQRTATNIVAGDPMHEDTNFGALISAKHREKVLSYIDKGIAEGARLLCGGEAMAPPSASQGYFVAPTVFTDCRDDMSIVRDEIFGPVMSLLSFEDEEEVINRANNTGYGLAAGVFTNDLRRAHRVIHRMQAGICWINAYGNSPAQMPVGGYKLSGVGRENGMETLRQLTQLKSVYVGMTPLESPF